LLNDGRKNRQLCFSLTRPGSKLVLHYYNAGIKGISGMYFIIEYVDTVTGIQGEALSWEFAKTEDEAAVKARAHFLLFKARFGAQGYRILNPAGLLLACGPEAPELDVYTIPLRSSRS
jgi:hypothetical protein